MEGAVLVVTNGSDHQRETRAVVASAFEVVVGKPFPNKPVDVNFEPAVAVDELSRRFDVSLTRYTPTLAVPATEPVLAYIGNLRSFVGIDSDSAWTAFLDAARAVVDSVIASDGAFRITGSAAVLVCRPA